MAENVSPTSLSPVLKDTSSVYSETPDFLVNSHEDTVDRLLKKRGLSMTPVLQDISRSPDKSFVYDSCIDDFLMTPKSPLGLKNKQSNFRQKSDFAKPAAAKRNTARYSNVLQSSTEDNSISDISFFNSGSSNDKQKLRQTANFRNQKRKTDVVAQDLSLEDKTDSSLTSISIVEENKRRTNFRARSKQAITVTNVFDNVLDSTGCETSFSDTILRKSTAFGRRSEKAPKRQVQTAFTDVSLSSENSSQELSASKRPKRSENSRKFKKASAATGSSDTLNGFDDAFSDSFTTNMSANENQKLKGLVNYSYDNVSQTNDFDDALGSDSFDNSMSTSGSQKLKEKVNRSSVSHSSSKSSEKTIENEKGSTKTSTDHELQSSFTEKSANVSVRRSTRSQNKEKDSSTLTDDIFEVGHPDSNASTAKPSSSMNNSRTASLRKSSGSVNKSVSLTNLDLSKINALNDSRTSSEQNKKSRKSEDVAAVVTDPNHSNNKSQLDRSINSSVLNKSEELSTSSRRSSRKLGKQADRSVNSSKSSSLRAQQNENVEKSFAKESPEDIDLSLNADVEKSSNSANTTRRSRSFKSVSSHNNTSTGSSSEDQQNTSTEKSGNSSRMSSNDDSNRDKSSSSVSSKSSSQLLSLSVSDDFNSEERHSYDVEKLDESQSNQSKKRKTSNVSRSKNESMHAENGGKFTNTSNQSLGGENKKSKSSSQLSSFSESKSAAAKEDHDSPAIGKSKKSSLRLSGRLEKSIHENPDATYVNKNSSIALFTPRSRRSPNAENFENASNLEKSNESSSSLKTTRRSTLSNQHTSMNSSNAQDQETLNSPSNVIQQSENPPNKSINTSRVTANSLNKSRTSRSQSKISDVTNPTTPTVNTSSPRIPPRESHSKPSSEIFSSEDIGEVTTNNESSSSELTGIVINTEHINFKRYSFNSENELVPKTSPEHKTDKVSKSFMNASDVTVVSNNNNDDDDYDVNGDDDCEEDSIFNERSCTTHGESDSELDNRFVNKSLSSYNTSKICPRTPSNQTFVRKSVVDSAKASPSTSSSSSSNERRASLRRGSSSNKSLSDPASTTETQAFSTITNFSMFASGDLGSRSEDSIWDASGLSNPEEMRNSRRLTNNISKFIKIDPKDNTTELDYEDTSKFNLSGKSVAEDMRLHITDDPPVCSLITSKHEVDPNDISVHEPSFVRGDNTQSSDENQQNDKNHSTQNRSREKAASSNLSKTRRSVSLADQSFDKSVTNRESSKKKSVGHDTDNLSHRSQTTSGESFEILAEDTLNSTGRTSRKRSSQRREHEKTELSRADKLELSREAVEETGRSINVSAGGSYAEETRNDDYTEDINHPDQESRNGSMCGGTFVSGATSQNGPNYDQVYLKDGSDINSDSEYFSSINGTPSVKSTAAGPANTNFNEYFAKPLYPVNRRFKNVQNRSSIDSVGSSGSLSLLSKCIGTKQGRRSNTRKKQQPSSLRNNHTMNLRKREEAFPKSAAPKMSRPAYWVTNKLYSFLTEKLEPQYNILAKKKAENFVNFLQEKCKKLMKEDDEESQDKIISTVKDQMVELRLVNSDFMFYNFCQEFLPYETSDRIVPSAVLFSDKCSKANFNPDELFVKYF